MFSSMCTVFAESEAVSLIAKGIGSSDITIPDHPDTIGALGTALIARDRATRQA